MHKYLFLFFILIRLAVTRRVYKKINYNNRDKPTLGHIVSTIVWAKERPTLLLIIDVVVMKIYI